MTGNLYQGEGNYNAVVGKNPHGRLPHPAIQALSQGSFGPVKSDMQVMADNERKQHEQTYIYEHGHNDHGMGQ
jgi:hypothetical protein